MSQPISIVCPACGNIFGDDPWDCLPEDEVHQLTCQACRAQFFMSLFECEACVSDNVITSMLSNDCVDRTCRKCGFHPGAIGEDYEESLV